MARKKRRYISKKRARRNQKVRRVILIISIIIIIILILLIRGQKQNMQQRVESAKPEIDVQLLDPNEYSRPQIALDKVKGIVVHYTANPGTSAQANRDYFNNLATTHTTKASSHFIIGLEGEIIQCIPTSEEAYASNERNQDTLAIECCIQDDTGAFNDATYQSLVRLTAWLCGKFSLDPLEDVIRHYDITGKSCPKYYVEHPKAFTSFKEEVQAYMKEWNL